MLGERDIVSGSDFDFLLFMIKRHKDASLKIGCGVSCFKVMKTYWKSTGFYIQRTDGSLIDFSYHQCVSPKEHTHIQKLRMACRFQLKDSIHYDMKTKGIHNHHAGEPFESIFASWTKTINPDQIAIEEAPEYYCMANREDMKSWIRWHDARAVIIPMSEEEHRKLHKNNINAKTI
jgi:hypothetical protein